MAVVGRHIPTTSLPVVSPTIDSRSVYSFSRGPIHLFLAGTTHVENKAIYFYFVFLVFECGIRNTFDVEQERGLGTP